MATKTRGRILLPALLIAGGFVVVTQTEVGTDLAALVGLGDEPEGMAVPPDFHAKVRTCTVAQVVTDKRCGDEKILPIDAKKMPYIARNITLAWKSRPGTAALTKASYKEASNYRDSGCATFKRNIDPPERGKKGSCDEYPFKSTEEGGKGSRIEEVPRSEQDVQGGTVSSFYAKHKMGDGDKYLVVIVNTASIATTPYKG